ncbi:hypothetical protein O181_007555 [Austropuccinia psidii MF-1]|uniref:E3 ubiquitin-protein ligase PEP5 n=1 Tax=Austropuccinia psidii MF-1 TaxID=1389203 RepID=A0A9Q3BMM5_9BASI|nr:hypothetical protein [Austropuccinia psidii MF-1]
MGDNKNVLNGSTPTWRHFNFFNSYPVQSTTDLALPPKSLSQPQSISNVSSAFGSCLIAHFDGRISLIDHNFHSICSWSAFPGGRTLFARSTKINRFIISIGEELNDSHPTLKIWKLAQEQNHALIPQLLAHSKIQTSNRPHPVTAFASTPTLSHLAIGLADGTLLLYRHLDQALIASAASLHSNKLPPPLSKPKIIYSSSEPITGLAFRSPNLDLTQPYVSNSTSPELIPKLPASYRHTCLFIVTTSKVLCYFASGRGTGVGSEPVVMDDLGGSVGCSELTESGNLILADESALYVYGPEGREACLAYEGPKAKLLSWGNYLLISSPPISTGPKADLEQSRLVVFDLHNRFIAYSAQVPGSVQHVWAEWGDLFILTRSGEATRLVERPLADKLLILYDKDMYILAINVAKSSGADSNELAEIHRRFGDYLYQKSDFEGAVQEYILTIGTIQPSFVIRKFLDAQRISNLTSYLQELHAQGVANTDHTTLLLNCYTKLKDHAKLDDFIKANERTSTDNGGQLPFDLETAIRVCRQAGYYEHALYLAKQYSQDEDYLRIQIEDRGEWLDALRYMRALGFAGAEANLLRYGKPLLANLPEETTDLMIDVCCGTKLEREDLSNDFQKLSSDGADRSPYRVYQSAYVSSNSSVTRAEKPRDGAVAATIEAGHTVVKELPQLRQFFAFFIDQPQCFIRFLETVAERRWSEKMVEEEIEGDLPESSIGVSSNSKPPNRDSSLSRNDQADVITCDDNSAEDREAVWGTLLELYLQSATDSGEESIRMKKRALGLLKWGASGTKLRYEPTQALIVCLTHDFLPGIVLMYERLGMIEDIVRFWIDQADDVEHSRDARREIFKTLDKYGEDYPELYPIVLRYLASSNGQESMADVDRESQDDGLENVLEEIERRKVLSPIEVIEILSKPGSVACIGTIKNYLLRQVIDEQRRIESDQALINSYRKENEKKEKEIKELCEEPQVFQMSKCSNCLGSLDLPAVHFMCKHSFHQRCLGDQNWCTKCDRKGENEVMREMMSRMKRTKELMKIDEEKSHGVKNPRADKVISSEHEMFVEEVIEADEPFDHIASAFSKGYL